MLPENFWDVYRERVPVDSDPVDDEMLKLRDEIIMKYAYLGSKVTMKMVRSMPEHVTQSDYESAAMIALVLAVKSFDPEYGVPFEPWATLSMQRAILDEVRRNDWATRSLRTAQRELKKAEAKFRSTQGREPSKQELAEAAGLSMEELDKLLRKIENATHTYIEGSVEAQNKPVAHNPEEEELVTDLCKALAGAMTKLSTRKATILALHYYDQKKLLDISKMLRMSVPNVSTLHREAILEVWHEIENVLRNE